MDTAKTFYDILELDVFADAESVKAAFRRLARQYHPDTNPNNPKAEARFKEIGEAYATLSNPGKKAQYDILLRASQKSRNPRAAEKAYKEAQSQDRKEKPKEPEATKPKPTPSDAKPTSSGSSRVPPRSKAKSANAPKPGDKNFKAGSGFKDLFDTLFTKAAGQAAKEVEKAARKTTDSPSQKPQRGQDITVDTLITDTEATSGVVKPITIQHTEGCARCSSTGRLNGAKCPVCGGEKHVVSFRKLDVKIPASVKNGSKIRVAKEGGRGQHGGDHGDLFLVISVKSDGPKVDIPPLNQDVPITLTEAVLGGAIEFSTPTGKVSMTLPPLTPNGKTFRLKGQGQKVQGETGDLMVTVILTLPESLSSEEKALYEQLAKLSKHKPKR